MTQIEIRRITQCEPMNLSIWRADVFPYSDINEIVLKEFNDAKAHWDHSHPVNGRWENIYFPTAHATQTVCLLEHLLKAGESIVNGRLRLHHDPADPEGNGWWLNKAMPLEKTGVHNHSPRAALSGVFYLSMPADGGNIVFHPKGAEGVEIVPREGLVLFFPPTLRHSVKKNLSSVERVSLAFNLYRVR